MNHARLALLLACSDYTASGPVNARAYVYGGRTLIELDGSFDYS